MMVERVMQLLERANQPKAGKVCPTTAGMSILDLVRATGVQEQELKAVLEGLLRDGKIGVTTGARRHGNFTGRYFIPMKTASERTKTIAITILPDGSAIAQEGILGRKHSVKIKEIGGDVIRLSIPGFTYTVGNRRGNYGENTQYVPRRRLEEGSGFMPFRLRRARSS
jgi:hypothetical protein